MIFGTIVYQWPFNINPRLSSEVHNSLFCAVSRIIVPTGVMIFIMVIFLNQMTWAKAMLSSSNAILLAKSLPIACLTEWFIFQYMFCTQHQAPRGVFVNLKMVLIYGIGLFTSIFAISVANSFFQKNVNNPSFHNIRNNRILRIFEMFEIFETFETFKYFETFERFEYFEICKTFKYFQYSQKS